MNILHCLKKHSDDAKTAIHYKNETISYRELNDRSYILSTILQNNNSEITGLFIENSISYFIAYFGILYADKIIMPLNTAMTKEEIKSFIHMSNMNQIVTLSKYEDLFSEMDVDVVVVDGMALDTGETPPLDVPKHHMDEKTAIIFPTSGTTGKPKLVMISHKSLTVNINAVEDVYHNKRDENELIMLPLFSAFGNIVALYCMNNGMTLTIYNGLFTPNKFFQLVNQNNITYCTVVPSLLKLLSCSYNPSIHHIPSLKRFTFGGERLEDDEFVKISEKMSPVALVYGYGLTEAGPSVASKTYNDWNAKTASVGKAMTGVEIKIVGDGYETLECNQIGSVLIKGKNITHGYYGGEQVLLYDGWFDTEDLGYLDDEGYLFIVGRKKNIIISAGKNISPEEVEGVILKSGLVQEVVVYGKADEETGEAIWADVIVPDGVLDKRKLEDYCRKYLTEYKIPKEFNIVESIQKTQTNKIKRVKKESH